MDSIIVVDQLKDWNFNLDGVEVVSGRDYLTDLRFSQRKRLRVFNLCNLSRYQSLGYYVSLLAEARGHRSLPNMIAMQDLKYQVLSRVIVEEVDELIQKSFRHLKSDQFTLSIYFERNVARQYDKLSKALSQLFQSPLLRVNFIHNKKWILQSVKMITLKDVPPSHMADVNAGAKSYFSKKRYPTPRAKNGSYNLAILINPDENPPPSNKAALMKFEQAARSLNLDVEFITKLDFSRLAEFDALFIRETTSVNHHTYRFARKALSEGLAVIDDPNAILKCTNKVYLAELLGRAKIPTPKSLIVYKNNWRQINKMIGLPCVLKVPDGSFSHGVIKVETEKDLEQHIDDFFDKSDLILAQEFLPTEYDWRIGIIDNEIIYACKYFMAKGHWQIINWNASKRNQTGPAECVAFEQIPEQVKNIALKAAHAIGDGFYGVDVKQCGERVVVIEVNDNPSIDAGEEDRILGNVLYQRIIQALLHRILACKNGHSP